jgi:hypothetical protein
MSICKGTSKKYKKHFCEIKIKAFLAYYGALMAIELSDIKVR